MQKTYVAYEAHLGCGISQSEILFQFHETFSCLHASNTVYEEVLEMAENQEKRKRRRMTGKTVVACIATVVVSGITVAAAAQSGFFSECVWHQGAEGYGGA